MADEILKGKSNVDKRKIFIKEAYNTILKNSKISDAVKDWVVKNHSIQDIAEIKKINVSVLKNQIYYINSKLGKDWTYKDKSIIKLCLLDDDIFEEDWEELETILRLVSIKQGKNVYDKKPLISNKNLLVNIPSKAFNTEIDDKSFNKFLDLIKPYFIEQRRKVQQLINDDFLYVAGYFNYIMTPGVSLTDEDKKRLKRIQILLDEDTKQQYRKENKEVIESLRELQELEEHRLSESESQTESMRQYRDNYNQKISSGEISTELKTTRVKMQF